MVCRYREIKTWTRYLDWFLSTPIMLVSTAFFFRHRGVILSGAPAEAASGVLRSAMRPGAL